MTTAARIRWRATGPDGIAHAYYAPVANARCGAPNQEERYDWPLRVHCALCLEREEERKKRKAG